MFSPSLGRGAAIGAIAAAALLAACAPTRPAAVNLAPAAAVKPTEAPARPAAAIGAVARPKADGPQLQIKDFAFAPKEITVPVGTTLTWTNKDSEPHTVTTTDKAIASKAMDTDTFHTARSTAFPQPEPGKAAAPGPMNVPAEQLKSFLGVSRVDYRENPGSLAIVDSTLG
jgi:plastocyanin